jgi:hypothetical protein
MDRVLVVVRETMNERELQRLCNAEPGSPCEIAVCCVLPTDGAGLAQGLRAQRELTATLRRALGERAEAIPVFVASDGHGQSVEECARSWGATLVKP